MTLREMVAKAARWLRTPVGWAAAWIVGGGVVAVVVAFAFDLPGRWVDGWPRLARAVAYLATGVAFGMVISKVRIEVERWCRLRDEYAAAQRDIERMERGE